MRLVVALLLHHRLSASLPVCPSARLPLSHRTDVLRSPSDLSPLRTHHPLTSTHPPSTAPGEGPPTISAHSGITDTLCATRPGTDRGRPQLSNSFPACGGTGLAKLLIGPSNASNPTTSHLIRLSLAASASLHREARACATTSPARGNLLSFAGVSMAMSSGEREMIWLDCLGFLARPTTSS